MNIEEINNNLLKVIKNGNSILKFLKDYTDVNPKETELTTIDENGTEQTRKFGNIAKQKEEIGKYSLKEENHLYTALENSMIKHIIGDFTNFKVITPLKSEGYCMLHFKNGITGGGIPVLEDTSEFTRVISAGYMKNYRMIKHQFDIFSDLNDPGNTQPEKHADFWKLTSSQELEYKGIKPIDNKIPLLFLKSPSSINNCKVLVNGAEFDVINLEGENEELIYTIKTDTDEKVDITIQHLNATGFVYLKGVNLVELKRLTFTENDFDMFLDSGIDESYTNTNGASDFALFDSDDNGFCLSYHGGEVNRSTPFILGDKNIINLNDENGCFSRKIEIYQKTKLMNSKLNIDTLHTILDGGYKLDTKVKGDINTTCFFTFMNTTNPSFKMLYVPKVLQLVPTDEGEYEILGDKEAGIIIQAKDNRSVESRFTIFKDASFFNDGKPGVVVKKHSYYLKPYYGWHKGSTPRNLKELSFSSVRLYT